MPFLKYFREFRILYGRYFWSGLALLTITNALDVIPPLIIMRGIDQITNRASEPELLKTALIFGGLTLALSFVRFHWRMQWGRYHQNLARDLRNRIFTKLTQLGPTFYTKNSTGELMSLISNDVESVRMGMGPGVLVLTDAFLYFVTIPPIMMTLSWSLTWKTLILLPLLPVFVHWLGNIIDRRFSLVQERFSELSGITQENIAGIRLVKSYVQEDHQTEIFNRKSRQFHEAALKVAWPESFMHPVMEFCVSVGVFVLILWGGRDVIAGTLTVGTFFAFHRYISKMAWPMTAIGWGFSLVSQARSSIRRIDEFLSTPLDTNTNPETARPLERIESVQVKDLSFSYPASNTPALQNLSFQISDSETLGVIGPVGAGKTTIINLLTGLYLVDRNKIFINGVDINDIPVSELRKQIAVIPQDAFLFSQTVVENLGFGLTELPSPELSRRYARVTAFEQEVETLPQKWETLLGDRGVNLSGGQKQRLTMARALIRQSSLVIFDDSLSSVDAETESTILSALKDELAGKMKIIVSHRLSAVRSCDQLLVLHQGTAEALGNPSEVAKQSRTLQELLRLQGHESDRL
ncbi:MAG: ABC transporter ATP-binding protein [Oligoflexia bacterium]|nr:ABC transporter ATP-binding protein [Oligoflexia bacterium]